MKTTLEELGVKRYQDGFYEHLRVSDIESLLSEGKLVKPMSEEFIKEKVRNFYGKFDNYMMLEQFVKAIYTAQFERTEK